MITNALPKKCLVTRNTHVKWKPYYWSLISYGLGLIFSKASQTPRSRYQKCSCLEKSFVPRNTHVKYKKLITNHSKFMVKVEVFQKTFKLQSCDQSFSKEGQTPRSCDQKACYLQKSLITRNTHMKYESSITNHPKVMAKVKVLQK